MTSCATARPAAPIHSAGPGWTIWFTGLSAAGKSTLARAVYKELTALGVRTEVLDADDIRKHLNRDLGFSKADRDENIRRIAYVASLLTRHGVVVLVAAISPYRAARDQARQRIGCFAEVYVDAPLVVCEQRDPIGLYRKLRAGEIHHIAGCDDPYESPLAPELHCSTDQESLAESTARVLSLVLSLLRDASDVAALCLLRMSPECALLDAFSAPLARIHGDRGAGRGGQPRGNARIAGGPSLEQSLCAARQGQKRAGQRCCGGTLLVA
jgi:adenylylsulfate kinase